MEVLLILLVAVSLHLGNAVEPGITMSVSQGGLNNMIYKLIPSFEEMMRTTTFEGISDSHMGFEFEFTDIVCSEFILSHAELQLDEPNALHVEMKDMEMKCHAHWSFRLKVWPHIPYGSGEVDILAKRVNAYIDAILFRERERPNIDITDASAEVKDVDLHFHGSFFAGILNFAKKTLIDAFVTQVRENFGIVIKEYTREYMDEWLKTMPIALKLPFPAPFNGTVIRYGLTSHPVVDKDFLGFAFRGDVVPTESSPPAPIPGPSLPELAPADRCYDIETKISTYLFETALYSFWELAVLQYSFEPASIPLGFGSTNGYGDVAPYMRKTYPDMPVSVDMAASAHPRLSFGGGQITITAPMDFTFWIHTSNTTRIEAFVLSSDISFTANVQLTRKTDQSLYLVSQVRLLKMDVSMKRSNVGDVKFSFLIDTFNLLINSIIVPIVNIALQEGIPLPTWDGITYTKFDLRFEDDYLSCGIDFTFEPPNLGVGFSDVMRAQKIKSHFNYQLRGQPIQIHIQ